jgi:Rho guanine nucleotide exchange factor 10
VSLMAHSGIGLWLSEGGSSTVCLYHTESCRHLQDIDVAPSVCRMLGGWEDGVVGCRVCSGLLSLQWLWSEMLVLE